MPEIKIPPFDIAALSTSGAFLHALCDEDRARIDALTAATNRLAQAIESYIPIATRTADLTERLVIRNGG